MPCSLSLIAYGTTKHHTEMRCRLVHQLATNSAEYMRGTVFGETEEGSWIVRMLTVLADAGAHADTDAVTPTDVQQACQGETMEIREKGVCMGSGSWQLGPVSYKCPSFLFTQRRVGQPTSSSTTGPSPPSRPTHHVVE